MVNLLSSIQPIQLPELPQTTAPGAAPTTNFRDVFDQAIAHVEQPRATAQQAAQNFLAGGSEELHSVVLAAQRASMAFDMFLQVRNKVVSAYQEVMRTQV